MTAWTWPGSTLGVGRGYGAIAALVGVTTVLCWLCSVKGPRERRLFWRLGTASCAAWTVAYLYLCLTVVFDWQPAHPRVDEIALCLAYLITLPTITIATGSRLTQWRAQVDAVIVSVVITVGGWEWYLRPQLPDHVDLTNLFVVGYPVFDVAFFVIFMSVTVGGRRRISTPVLLVVADMAVGSAADVVTAGLYLHGVVVPPPIMQIVALPAVLLVLLGALRELAAAGAGRGRGAQRQEVRTLALDLGVAPVLVAVTGVLVWAGRDALVGQPARTSFALVLLVVVGLVVRTQLGARDLRRVAQQLDGALEEQRRLAVTDGLTGLYNRRMAEEVLGMEVERASRSEGSYSMAVAILDLDHFKKINHVHGHAAGDIVLTEAAIRFAGALRGSDLLARWGGEEFLVVLPQVDPTTAGQIAERLRGALAGRSIRLPDGERLAVTVSIGVAVLDGGTATTGDIVRAADEALYAAKAGGRDRVRHAPALTGASTRRAAAPPLGIAPAATATRLEA